MSTTICICGAGTMGAGIAQVSAHAGFNTILFDINKDATNRAKLSIEKNLVLSVDKKKISSSQKISINNRIHFTNDIEACTGEVIIEAIAEIEEAKILLFNELAKYNSEEVIFASNTSSLSITSLQKKIIYPQRVIGMHFFNPAYIMKLVEVVKGIDTNDEIANTIVEICKQMGKEPVLCRDTPGFVVNRIARHYYLEAMTLVEQGVALLEDIDTILEASGFKMGPFKLMDLIGLDINLAVSQSMYNAYKNEERFKPSTLQLKKVAIGELGKKVGKGFYTY